MGNEKIKISSNRSFGIVFFIFFVIVSIFPLFKDGNIRIWSLIIAIIFLILGLLNSKILSPLNKIWFKFGILLGNFISPVVMGLIFFTVVTPTSLIMKAFGKDLLNLKKSNKKSYWIEKSDIKSRMKNQF
ncbi:SxtJ family membrane protein [Candidatus Pelagibacter sp. Uisw_092]|uniref:SxtJ family membrane protein n=1 Tax=Candidatus Pelagibacter sp. Uisw_092 TaxID=3230979 RepID=UPI0039EA13CD